MSDEIHPLVALIGAAVAIKVGATLAKGVGRGIGSVANSLAEEALRQGAFSKGLEGKAPPRLTGDYTIDQSLENNYEAGRRERELQVHAASRMISLNATEIRHVDARSSRYIEYDD